MYAAAPRIAIWPRTGLALGVGLLLGIAVQLQQASLLPAGVYALFVLLAPVMYARVAIKKRADAVAQALVLLAASAFAWSLTGLRALLFVSQALTPALEGRDVLVTGVVADMPQFTEAGLRMRLATEAAELDGQAVQVPALLDVGWYTSAYNAQAQLPELQRPPPDVRAGQRWRMQLRLKAPHGSVNPLGFDYELYLWEQGVQATGYVRATASAPPPQMLGQTWTAPIALARQGVRERIQAHVADARSAGLLAALVVGDQRAIDRSDWDVFRATGVSHLVSISGTHITMFAWLAVGVVGWLWRGSARLCGRWPAPHAALVCGVGLAWAYALFSGWGVPAQRTCVMLATVAVLRLSGARWPWPWVWLLTAVVVLLWDPWAMLQAGFWLSFVAVGVLFASSIAMNLRAAPADAAGASALKGSKVGSVGRRGVRAVAQLQREQWVVTLALAPLGLLLFGQVSLIGLAANALAIPWVTLVLTPLALAGVAWPELWTAASGAVALLYAGLDVLAAWPWSSWSAPVPPVAIGAAGVVGGVLLVLPMPWAVRSPGVPLLLLALLWRPALPAPGEFELLAADIGQGNAVLVQTAQHALLFDTGPRYSLDSDAGNRVLLPLLKALDVRLDTVVLSHRDTDHVGGAAAVLMQQPHATLLSSLEPQHALQQFRQSERCEAGQRWEWDGVVLEVLHPSAAAYAAQPAPQANALSCVLRISNGHHTALLAGDIEAAQERQLLADPDTAAKLRADVLLVPHHGSKTSSTPEFLQAVQPRHALVQAGYRNRYGHPVAQVLERYEALGTHLVLSPRCGAARWRSAEPQNVACMREDQRHYWRHDVP